MAKRADIKLKEFTQPVELLSLVNDHHDVPRSKETNRQRSFERYYMKMLENKML